MKKMLCLMLFVLFFQFNSFSQIEKESIEASISKFFDGISEINADKLKANATQDFILLEDGAVWNMDTLITKVYARKNSGIKRINKFQFINTEQNGNIAWVTYHNTAEFSLNEKQKTVNWLESAVLSKENGTWKIKLLHSTRVVPPKQNSPSK